MLFSFCKRIGINLHFKKSYFQVLFRRFATDSTFTINMADWRGSILFLSAETGDKLRMQEELKDLVEKDFVAFPDVAADVINALLFEGKPLVNAGDLLSAPTETLY